MPEAICALYATGQDDHADTHLGAVLEWLKPADGQVYDRILEAESQPTSTATDPRLDNEKLVPLVDALGRPKGPAIVLRRPGCATRSRTFCKPRCIAGTG